MLCTCCFMVPSRRRKAVAICLFESPRRSRAVTSHSRLVSLLSCLAGSVVWRSVILPLLNWTEDPHISVTAALTCAATSPLEGHRKYQHITAGKKREDDS